MVENMSNRVLLLKHLQLRLLAAASAFGKKSAVHNLRI